MNQLSVYDLSVETSQTPSKFVSPGPHCSEKRFEKWTFKTQNILLVLYTVRQWVIKRTLPKLTVTNIFHLFVVFILLIWFLYNSLYVIKQYLRFETVVYIEYKDPEWTNIPSITLCTHCIYCSYNDTELNNLSVHSAIQNKECIHTKEKYFLKSTEVILDCQFIADTVHVPQSQFNCTDIAPMIVSMQEGHKCFTFFSDIYGHVSQSVYKKYMVFENFPKIRIRVSDKFLMGSPTSRYLLYQKNFWNENETNAGIYVSIHSSSVLPEMVNVVYHRLMPNRYTTIRFSKMIEILQPPPYVTKCVRYSPQQSFLPEHYGEWIIASRNSDPGGGIGIYRSRGECLLYCIWRAVNNRGCVNFYSMFTETHINQYEQYLNRSNIQKDLSFCKTSSEQYQAAWQAREKCKNQCQNDCYNEYYIVDDLLDLDYPNSQNLIDIEWSVKPVTTIKHIQMFTIDNLLGNLGGHAHIWLGLSVINIFRNLMACF